MPFRDHPVALGSTVSTDFATLAKLVLKELHRRLGFALWMVTRTEGDDWIVLESEDHGYGVKAPALFRWTDSFCSRMVNRLGPRVAPNVADIPAYVDAPIGKQVPIGSYIGIPLTWPDGKLFGTLCAIDPLPKQASIEEDLPFVELIATMLTAQIMKDLTIADLSRKTERAQNESETDALTGLLNRRGWDRVLALEEDRCRHYGHPAGVVVLDLDGLKAVNDNYGHIAGDELLRKTAKTLRSNLREKDAVARIGGDEFSILLTEGSVGLCHGLSLRLRSAFDAEEIPVSIGMSPRGSLSSLTEATNQADSEMYMDKRRRKHIGTLELVSASRE